MTWISSLNGFVNIAQFALPALILVWADRAPPVAADRPDHSQPFNVR